MKRTRFVVVACDGTATAVALNGIAEIEAVGDDAIVSANHTAIGFGVYTVASLDGSCAAASPNDASLLIESHHATAHAGEVMQHVDSDATGDAAVLYQSVVAADNAAAAACAADAGIVNGEVSDGALGSNGAEKGLPVTGDVDGFANCIDAAYGVASTIEVAVEVFAR